jgi:hypothetical protein
LESFLNAHDVDSCRFKRTGLKDLIKRAEKVFLGKRNSSLTSKEGQVQLATIYRMQKNEEKERKVSPFPFSLFFPRSVKKNEINWQFGNLGGSRFFLLESILGIWFGP